MPILDRRRFLTATGMALPMPLLAANAPISRGSGPRRLVIVGNPYGMHPQSFFPKTFGKRYKLSPELQTWQWLQDRFTVFSHVDHNMESGHFKEAAFLSGILPRDAGRFPDRNVTLDQVVGEHFRKSTRYHALNTSLRGGMQESWTRSGVPVPILSPQQLYQQLFVEAKGTYKKKRKDLRNRNRQLLDAVSGQYRDAAKPLGYEDRQRMDQYLTAVHDLNQQLDAMDKWHDAPKPSFDGEPVGETIQDAYQAMFDMVLVALQSDSTRVATITFPKTFNTADLDLTKSYHAYTHNGKLASDVKGLQTIEIFQLEQTSRFLKKLDALPEPNGNGSMLDHTLVMFGSPMGYGGTHSNRNLPILLAGGGLKHQGHVDLIRHDGSNRPLCNLYLSMIHAFGIERDVFNLSNGTVSI
jgi:hypothetical protein